MDENLSSTSPSISNTDVDVNFSVKFLRTGVLKSFIMPSDTKIEDVRREIRSSFSDLTTSTFRLIYNGRALHDQLALKDYDIANGTVLYVTGDNPIPGLSLSAAGTDHNSRNANEFGLSSEAHQLINSTVVSAMMERPEFFRMIIDSNPQLRELREQNPEINQILNDPQLMRESLEAVNNPNVMREMMRKTDRAMSNIDAMPGGFNALRRFYKSIQEPMWEALEGQSGDRDGGNSEGRTLPTYSLESDRGLNKSALPNPWATPKQQQLSRQPAPTDAVRMSTPTMAPSMGYPPNIIRPSSPSIPTSSPQLRRPVQLTTPSVPEDDLETEFEDASTGQPDSVLQNFRDLLKYAVTSGSPSSQPPQTSSEGNRVPDQQQTKENPKPATSSGATAQPTESQSSEATNGAPEKSTSDSRNSE